MNLESSKNRTILAVDDKLKNLKVLINYLVDSGFELMVAQSGEEAFQHIKRVIPDMILLDVLMPGIDGFETCRRLKESKTTRDIPVIFMTALTDTVDKVRGFEAGAIDYLTKPLQHEEVLARVNAHMTTREFQQQLQEKNVVLQHKITAFSTLMQMEAHAGPIISESPAMCRVQKKIDELVPKSDPILISGEPGSGQTYVAKKIHEQLGNNYAPLIVVDCLRIDKSEANKLLFGSSEIEGFKSRAGGFGALHLADKGTLVLMNIEALDMMSQRIFSEYLEGSVDIVDIPSIRLIATTSEDIASFTDADRFLPKLAEQLAANVITMPTMLQRKRDILSLAKLFLAECEQRLGEGEYQLSRSAEHTLLSGQYRHRNAEELREAVEYAALFADGPEIVAEHIFTGPKSEGTPFDYNLSQVRFVKWLSRSATPVVALQSIVFTVFLLIILTGITTGNTIPGRIANGMIWGLWWPALMVIFLFVGRIWCIVCPLSSAGRIAQRIKCFKLNPPQWIMKHGRWLIVFLFSLLIWSEQVLHMAEHPFRSSMLLLSLMIAAMLFSVLFKRDTWCRYICPLGNLGATYAVSAMVYVRANPSVCAAKCKTHECFKGSPTSRECPVFHHPLYARDGHFCKMCFSCVRSCPHGSANLYIRLPLQNIWHLGDLSSTLTPLALVGFFLAIVLLGARNTVWLATPCSFTVALVIAVTFAVILHAALPRMLSQEHNPDPTLASRVALALLILGWGPLMVFHLEKIPGLAALQFRVVEGYFWTSHLPITDVTLLRILQLGVILLAAIFAMISLRQIWTKFVQHEIKARKWGWRILLMLCAAYLLTVIGILLS